MREFPRDEVILLWHDTKEEHPDTYRFIREMAEALGIPITERSDGRSVTQLFRDEGYLGNNQNTFCSRILKAEPGARYVAELKAQGFTVTKIIGYSAKEPRRVARMVGRAHNEGIEVRFPVIEEGVTKQQCAEWVLAQGVQPSAMYCWADHANCIGCVKACLSGSFPRLRVTRISRFFERGADGARSRRGAAIRSGTCPAKNDRSRKLTLLQSQIQQALFGWLRVSAPWRESQGR